MSTATAQKVEIVAPRKTGCFTWLVAIFFGVMFTGWCATTFRSTAPAPSPAASAPPTPREPDLSVEVSFDGTRFTIKNNDADDWTDTRLMVNPGMISDGHYADVGTVPAKGAVKAGAMQFADSDGQRFNPFTTKPRIFAVAAKVNGKVRTWRGGFR